MKKNLYRFIFSTSLFDFAFGMFGPLWFLFLSDFGGGLEQFSFAVALMMLASAFTSLFVGKLSDSVGRKAVLVTSGIGVGLVILLYTAIDSIMELYILQAFYGMLVASYATGESAIMGDLTEKTSRGADIGKIQFTTQISSAAALLLLGLIGEAIGVTYLFHFVSATIIVSSLLLLRVDT